MPKTKMSEQPPEVRNKNFREVALGYTLEEALQEAKRCLQCKKPRCMQGCPVEVDIPDFIKEIKENNIDKAYAILTKKNSLPAICGRVCPQEVQCEQLCVLAKKDEPVGVGRLERFTADHGHGKEEVIKPQSNGIKVAVIGSGPAGLTAAGDLARMGYEVTVFEALSDPGGVLTYGIPEFRLPAEVVNREVEFIKQLGVKVNYNTIIGKTITLDQLRKEGYQAFFIGTGAGLPNFMNIPGENCNGVYSANEFLTRVNLVRAFEFPKYDTPVAVGRRVAVVGGGNVAMDSARTALRLGAEKVYLVYRRSMTELPARLEEVHHAQEEGVEFLLLNNPVEILCDEKGWVRAMKCIKMELGEPDASGRRRPVEVKGSEFDLEVQTVIMAIGTSPNPLIPQTTKGLEVSKWGTIIVNEETGQTSLPDVFAGGDIVTGAATVISAMGAGKKAAKAMDRYIKEKIEKTENVAAC